jgi:predicted amidohydrolase YtcJ
LEGCDRRCHNTGLAFFEAIGCGMMQTPLTSPRGSLEGETMNMKLKWCLIIVLILSACTLNDPARPGPDEMTIIETETPAPDDVGGDAVAQTEEPIQTEDMPLSEPPNLIFYNGQVLTIDNNMRAEEAIAILDGLIVAVGPDDEILALAGPSTQLVDLQGHTLMPGFVDPHTHILNDAEYHLGLTLEEAQDLALENGITTLANMFVPDWFLQDLYNLESEGNLRVRTSAYLIGTDNCGEPQGDWYKAFPPTDEFGEMLRIGGVKLFTDGGSCGVPAVSQEVLSGLGQGDLFLSNEELDQLVRMADDAGYQLAIHAIGDRAIDQAIDALDTVIDSSDNPERHRIEHVTYLRDGQFNRFSEIGIHPVIFGNSPTCYITENGSDLTEQFPRVFRRIRELVDANPGLIIAAKTDFPWRGRHASPLHELYSLTTFKEISQEGLICEPTDWLVGRSLTIDEALPMVTINAAYLLFREDEVGSLEPGKLADLIVLSENPLEVELDELKDIEVWMTMVGGETAYCAPGYEAYCP